MQRAIQNQECMRPVPSIDSIGTVEQVAIAVTKRKVGNVAIVLPRLSCRARGADFIEVQQGKPRPQATIVLDFSCWQCSELIGKILPCTPSASKLVGVNLQLRRQLRGAGEIVKQRPWRFRRPSHTEQLEVGSELFDAKSVKGANLLQHQVIPCWMAFSKRWRASRARLKA